MLLIFGYVLQQQGILFIFRSPVTVSTIVQPASFVIFALMLPDYPHKIFSDKRCSYTLLMLALAMDSAC